MTKKQSKLPIDKRGKKKLSKNDGIIIDSIIKGLENQTRISQIDDWDGKEKQVWLDNGGDIIDFSPEKDKIVAKYRVEITQVINGVGSKKLDKLYGELEKDLVYEGSDCDHIRNDDNNVFTISCKGERKIDKSDFEGIIGKDKDPHFSEHKQNAERILDDMRELKHENTQYIKNIIERYTDDYQIDEDDI